jgi:hypothetical protein
VDRCTTVQIMGLPPPPFSFDSLERFQRPRHGSAAVLPMGENSMYESKSGGAVDENTGNP